jgi:hypothetical protein
MDERQIKRLLITLGVAIVAIMISKSLMLKTATNLGNASAEKKRSVATQATSAPDAAEPISSQAVSATEPAEVAASSVEATNP